LLLIKGAPDILLPYCSYTVCPDGSVVAIDDAIRARISLLQESWASRGQRVILLARKIIKSGDGAIPTGMGFDHALFGNTIQQVAETGLTVLGLVGIVVRPLETSLTQDPPRDDIPEVVRICRTAGIRFFMVTGYSTSYPSNMQRLSKHSRIHRSPVWNCSKSEGRRHSRPRSSSHRTSPSIRSGRPSPDCQDYRTCRKGSARDDRCSVGPGMSISSGLR